MGINSLISLISKNLKMFFRSKISSFAVILIPFLVITITGFAFNSNNLSNVQVGIYSNSYSDFTKNIISDFENDNYTAYRYQSENECIESVKYTHSQICIIFPENLSPDLTSGEITFYVDYSRVNIAYNLINDIQESVMIRSSGVGETLAQDLINSLENIKTQIQTSKTKIDQTISSEKQSKKENSQINFPVSNFTNAIDELESAKNNLNSSDSSVISDIEDTIDKLKDLEVDAKSLSSDLSSIASRQDQTIQNLETISSNINSIISTLEARRSISAEGIVSPIKTRIESVNNADSNKDYIIPIALSLIALFGAILISSTFVLKEKKTKAFFRNFMAPTKNTTFILSTYLTCIIIMFIQFTLILLGIRYIIKMDITPVIFPLSIVVFAILSTFITIGMLIGYLFKTEETTIFSAMIIASILMFFSNVILPLENISSGLMKFLKFNPLVISNLALKKIILFGFGFEAIWSEVLILLGISILFFALNCMARVVTRRKL